MPAKTAKKEAGTPERRLYELGVSASQARVLAVLHYEPKGVD